MLFVASMIPLTKLPKRVKTGYVTKDGSLKVNHLLSLDDVKLSGISEKEIDSLFKTAQSVSKI